MSTDQIRIIYACSILYNVTTIFKLLINSINPFWNKMDLGLCTYTNSISVIYFNLYNIIYDSIIYILYDRIYLYIYIIFYLQTNDIFRSERGKYEAYLRMISDT